MEGAPEVLAERSGAMSGSGTLERRLQFPLRWEEKAKLFLQQSGKRVVGVAVVVFVGCEVGAGVVVLFCACAWNKADSLVCSVDFFYCYGHFLTYAELFLKVCVAVYAECRNVH